MFRELGELREIRLYKAGIPELKIVCVGRTDRKDDICNKGIPELKIVGMCETEQKRWAWILKYIFWGENSTI